MADPQARDGDLVLTHGTFAFLNDRTKGKVSVMVGPYKGSLSNTDELVLFDSARRQHVTARPGEATQVFPMAPDGYYMVLLNPVAGEITFPKEGLPNDAVKLDVGRKVNIPGPTSFALWPGQVARVIEGHRLRSNQFLMARVYDEAAAKKNWNAAVLKPAKTAPAKSDGQQQGAAAQETPAAVALASGTPDFTMGQLLVIKGTEASFFIPPTGIEIVPEGDTTNYVRDAVTLERLEYCILLAEDGQKKYVRGPAVVFPEPTETFVADDRGTRKFKAIELHEGNSGIYVKVIADYQEGDKIYHEGEELFITGNQTPIYFPRAEHSIITYDNKKVHHAIAIPAGEGRYVLDRQKGTVDLVKGPSMFLPDPRTQVVVRRILEPNLVTLLYPGNREALEVNARYAEVLKAQGAGDHLASSEAGRSALFASSGMRARGASAEFVGDEFGRGSTYSPPRTIVLDTKYDGAVSINIFPGYAILVAKKTGERRVEMGPKTVLLTYDETVVPLSLSTGRPKSDKTLLKTAYLRTLNNTVSDKVVVETGDLVRIEVEVSYRVNFEGDTPDAQLKWFGVENYVQLLADHARSRMRNAVKRVGIQDFYQNPIDYIRDALLGEREEGKPRAGLAFSENGMRIYDLEIINLEISDDDGEVAELLRNAQDEALRGSIQVAQAQAKLIRTTRLEELKRAELGEAEKTAEAEAAIEAARIQREVEANLAEIAGDLQVAKESDKIADQKLETEKKAKDQAFSFIEKETTQFLERLKGETEQFVVRAKSIDGNVVHALQAFGDKALAERMLTSIGPLATAMNVPTIDLATKMFKGTPLESVFEALGKRGAVAEIKAA